MFETELIICIKMDLALDNLQRLICHKTQPTNKNLTLVWLLLITAIIEFMMDIKKLTLSSPIGKSLSFYSIIYQNLFISLTCLAIFLVLLYTHVQHAHTHPYAYTSAVYLWKIAHRRNTEIVPPSKHLTLIFWITLPKNQLKNNLLINKLWHCWKLHLDLLCFHFLLHEERFHGLFTQCSEMKKLAF